MSDAVKINLAPLRTPSTGVLIVFTDDRLRLGPASKAALAPAKDLLKRAADAERFVGKERSALDILMPAGLKVSRLIAIGVGKPSKDKPTDFVKLGGVALGKVPASAKTATIFAELPEGPFDADVAADFALGMKLRGYAFQRYKTKPKEDEEKPPKVTVTLAVGDVGAARRAWARKMPVADGTELARDLVNEPPNVLYPAEFARRASQLRRIGVAIEVLNPQAMRRLGMRALLGVGQGSAHEPRLVVLRWNGGKRGEPPIAFIGKGVTFDTGGISIKPAQSMEDMKGDMAGGACVVGLMQALATRKAKVNAVGIVGLVENMPSGTAQRPGDIVKSMSGQTIEIINTDAEGRLVLADVLWYAKQRFKPRLMIDLATLTGAIIVALGQEYAGLFTNDDELAERLIKAGQASGERVWRMPLGPEYDKMIDSKFADMKNTGGRHGSSITAAQFLHRFVDKTPWAHLDIAGTGIGAPQTDINKSWGSGWGVRLLDRFVADNYEK
jgi:leucyl aminopeptidase